MAKIRTVKRSNEKSQKHFFKFSLIATIYHSNNCREAVIRKNYCDYFTIECMHVPAHRSNAKKIDCLYLAARTPAIVTTVWNGWYKLNDTVNTYLWLLLLLLLKTLTTLLMTTCFCCTPGRPRVWCMIRE